MSDLSTRVRLRREQLGLSQEELARRMGYRSRSSITKLEKGINDLPQSKVEELAQALETTPAALLGLDAPCACPPGFEPLPTMVQVPLIGSIACGTPITAEQNIECYIGVPAAWHADFALTCHGDSMSPTICNGDIVCIRCQPEVEQGEIAAVRVGEEATLKHFHRQGDAVMLLADNAAVCPPMFYAGEQLSELHIEGKAVGLSRGLYDKERQEQPVFGKKKASPAYDPAAQKPVLRCSICTGEQVAGFQDLHTGHFTEVQLIRSPQELQAFRSRYGIPADCPIEKIY